MISSLTYYYPVHITGDISIELKLVFPSVPLSVNQAYSHKGRRRYPSPALHKYKAHIKSYLLPQLPKAKAILKKGKFLDQPLYLHIIVDYSIWMTKAGKIRKADVTNRIKTIEDAVFEGLGIDDSQVWDCRITKGHPKGEQTLFKLSIYDPSTLERWD